MNRARISNLLHAIYASSYATKKDYDTCKDSQILPVASYIRQTIIDWLALLKHFSGLNYEPFQQALLKEIGMFKESKLFH